ncbi:hypothetical protein Tco_1327265 [Tanacetum coccineum]
MARKGLQTSVDKNDSEDSDEVGEQEESATDDLTELYRIVMNRYGMDGPEGFELEEGNFGNLFKSLVHCLNLESMDVYMLSERKYPLSAEVLGSSEVFTMSNQHKNWLVQEQTALGKDFSNPFYG